MSRGILEAHRAGVVTSTSVVVNMPWWQETARLLRSGPSLGVGLHLNLVQGRPLTRVPSLTDPRSGKFYPLRQLVERAFAGEVEPRDVRNETEAQLTRLQAVGGRVTHVDSHRHVHALLPIWAPVVEASLAANVEIVRRPAESLWLNPLDVGTTVKKVVLTASLLLVRRAPTRAADHFVGLSLQGCRGGPRRLLRVLDTLRPGTTELMVHVGYSDATLAALDGYTTPRELELAALTSAAVRERLSRGDIELIHFGQLRDME